MEEWMADMIIDQHQEPDDMFVFNQRCWPMGGMADIFYGTGCYPKAYDPETGQLTYHYDTMTKATLSWCSELI